MPNIARCRSGSTAVEFAIVAPVFLLLLCGLVVYGLYFSTLHAVQQLAAEAARASVAGLSETERRSIATRYVQDNAPGYALIAPAKVTVNAATTADSDVFEVAVTYDSSDEPFRAFGGLVPMPEPRIVRAARVRRGGF